jgi:hypothetical protein
VPPVPQLTVLPQESLVVPHDTPSHGPASGTHASGPQPVVQFTGRPQLSVVSPHRLLHQLGSDVQSHWLVDASQKIPSPIPQVLPQPVEMPQLSSPSPQWATHQLLSTSQDASAGASAVSPASLAGPVSAPASSTSCVTSAAASLVESCVASSPSVPSCGVATSLDASG